MHTHTQKEVNRKRGVRVRGYSPNEKQNQLTKETTTGKKGNKVRKRETMCETTHRKAKNKNKRDLDQCNRNKENVNKTL
jgi:hypothetical protein